MSDDYEEIQFWEVPPFVQFYVPLPGVPVEVAWGDVGVGAWREGASYKRVIDHYAAWKGPKYYRRKKA